MSFKPYTEKIKKKIGICPDPHQNDTDPKHWIPAWIADIEMNNSSIFRLYLYSLKW